jgi:DNA-binding response OmpR family regulator
MLVWILDDDVEIIELTKCFLESQGIQICTFTHPVEFLNAINSNETCNVLLLDVNMPFMDGLSVLQCLKDKHKVFYVNTNIIIMTALDFNENTEHYLQTKVNYYLRKPFIFKKLLKVMESLHS